MKIISKKINGNTVTLDALASKSEVEKAFMAAHVAFAQQMSIRPDGSKTIAQITQEKFGITNLDETIASQVVEYLVPFAVDTQNLAPAYPAYATKAANAQRGEELAFTCEFVLKTDLTLSSYEPVTIHVPPFVLVEEQIDKQLEEMANAHAEFIAIEPRPARMGDSCLVTIRAQENYADISDLSTEKAIYQLGSHLISAEFDEQLVGMSADEHKSFTLEMPNRSDLEQQDEAEEHEGDSELDKKIEDLLEGLNLKARTVDFDVQILEVREHYVPVIDDEWIKQNAPGVESLDAFKDLLRKEFNKSYQKEYDDMKRQLAVSELAKRYTGALPDEAMLAMQQTIINNLQSKLDQDMVSLEDYIKEAGGEQQFNLSTMMQSKDELSQAYALDALFLHEKLVLTDEDIREACKTIDAKNPDMIRKQMEYSGCGYMLRETAERLKAGTWLLEHAVVCTEA